MKKIYTIGHSNFDLLNIIVKLKKYDIDWVFDVRSVPFSRHTSQFNANNLEKELPKHGISYFKMGKFFGACQILPKHSPCYPNGYLDFELWCRTDEYRLAKKGMLERGLVNIFEAF